MGTRADVDEKIKIDDKLASQIHGILSSDSDSDFGRDFDEDYNALKPPPLDYESIRHMIVKVSRPKVVNIWEERSKNVQTNNEEVIQAGVTVVSKKKKKTKSKQANQVTSIGMKPRPTGVKKSDGKEQIKDLQSLKKKKEKHLNSWATLFSGSYVKNETKMKKKKFVPIDINFINEVYPESTDVKVSQKKSTGSWRLLENEFPDLNDKSAINRRISATSVNNDKPNDMEEKYVPSDIDFLNESYVEHVEKRVDTNEPEEKIIETEDTNFSIWDYEEAVEGSPAIKATEMNRIELWDTLKEKYPSLNYDLNKKIYQPFGVNFLNENNENFWDNTELDQSYEFPHGNFTANEITSSTFNYRIDIKDIMGDLSENTDEDDTQILEEVQTAKSVEILNDNQENTNSIFLNKNISMATDHISELNPVHVMEADVTSTTNKKNRRRKKKERSKKQVTEPLSQRREKKEMKLRKKKFVPINMNFINTVYPENIGKNLDIEVSEKNSTVTWTLLEDEFPDLNKEWAMNKRISATSVDNDKPTDMEEKYVPSDIDFVNGGYVKNIEKRVDTNEPEEKIIETEDTNFSIWDYEEAVVESPDIKPTEVKRIGLWKTLKEKYPNFEKCASKGIEMVYTNKSEEKIIGIKDNKLANKKSQPLEAVVESPYITPTEVKRIGLCETLKEKYPSVNYDLSTKIYEPLGLNFLNKSWDNTELDQSYEFLLKSTMPNHETNLGKDKKKFQPLDTNIFFNEGHIVCVENKAKEKVTQTKVTQTDEVLDKARNLEFVNIHESTSSPTKQPKKKSKKKSKQSVGESLAANVVDASDRVGGITGDILQNSDEDHTKILEEVHAAKSVKILADNKENSNSIFLNKTVEDALENKIQSSVNFPMATENIPELNPVDVMEAEVTSTANKKTKRRKRKKESKNQITEPISQNLSIESFDIENKSDVDTHDDIKKGEKYFYSNLSNDEYMSLVTDDINTKTQSIANLEVNHENPQYALENVMETDSIAPTTEKTKTKKKTWKKKKQSTTHLDAEGLDVAATSEKKSEDGVVGEGRCEENPIYVPEEYHIINEFLTFATISNVHDTITIKSEYSFKRVLGTAMQTINRLAISSNPNWQDLSQNFLCETYKEADMSQLTHRKSKAKRKRKKKSKHSPSIESHDEIEKNIPINEKIEEILTQPQETTVLHQCNSKIVKVSDLRGNISLLANLKTTYGVRSNRAADLKNPGYIFSTVLKNCIHCIDHSKTDIVIYLNAYMLYERLYRAYIACIQKNNKIKKVLANQLLVTKIQNKINTVWQFEASADKIIVTCWEFTDKICFHISSSNPKLNLTFCVKKNRNYTPYLVDCTTETRTLVTVSNVTISPNFEGSCRYRGLRNIGSDKFKIPKRICECFKACKDWQVKEKIFNEFFIQEDFNANYCVDVLPKREISDGKHTIYCALKIFPGTLRHLEATKEEIRHIYWKFGSPTTSLTDNTVDIIADRKNKSKSVTRDGRSEDKYCANATSTIFKDNKILTLPTRKLYDKEFPSLDIYRNSYTHNQKMNITVVPTCCDTNKRKKKKFLTLPEYSTDKSKDTLTKTDTYISNVETRIKRVFRKTIMGGSDTKIQSSNFSTVPKIILKHNLEATKETTVALKAKEEMNNIEKRKNWSEKILGVASLDKPYQNGIEKNDRFMMRVRKQSKDNFEEPKITQEKFQQTFKPKKIGSAENIGLVATPSENLASSEKSNESFEDFVKFFKDSTTILENCKRTSQIIHEEYKENVTKKDFEELLKKFYDVNKRALTIVTNCEQTCRLINERIKERDKVCNKADKPVIGKHSPKKRRFERKVGLCHRLARSNGAVMSYTHDTPEENNSTASSDRLHSRDCGSDKQNVAIYTSQNTSDATLSNVTYNKTEKNETSICPVVPSQRNIKSSLELAQRRKCLSTGPVKKKKVSFKPLATSSKTTDITKHFSEKNSNIAKLERFYADAGFDGPFQRMVARKRRGNHGRVKMDMTTQFFVLVLITFLVIIEIAVLSNFRNLSLFENISIIFFISLLYIYRNKQRLLSVL